MKYYQIEYHFLAWASNKVREHFAKKYGRHNTTGNSVYIPSNNYEEAKKEFDIYVNKIEMGLE